MAKAKVCPVCAKDIRENASVTTCPQCGVVHHMQCWEDNGGCCTKDCIAGGKKSKDIREIARMQHSAYRKKTVLPDDSLKHKKFDDNKINTANKKINKPDDIKPKKVEPIERVVPEVKPQEKPGRFIGYTSDNRMDEYMKALIQKNEYYYDQKFAMMNLSGKTTSWNWASFFLGSYWMIYRKMYLNAIVLFLVSGLVSCISFISPLVGMIISGTYGITLAVMLGVFGNSMYKNHIEKKYNEFRALSYDHRKQACIKHGGTSVGAVVLVIACALLLSILGVFLVVIGVISSMMSPIL